MNVNVNFNHFDSYFYRAQYTPGCDCGNYSKIWCMPCLSHMSTE